MISVAKAGRARHPACTSDMNLYNTVFAAGAMRFEFVVDSHGTTRHLLVHAAEGDLPAKRLPDQR